MIWYLYGTVLGWLMRPRKGDIGCLECAVFGHPWQPSHRNRRKWWVLDACTVILTGKTVKPPWLDDYNLFWNWTFMFFFFLCLWSLWIYLAYLVQTAMMFHFSVFASYHYDNMPYDPWEAPQFPNPPHVLHPSQGSAEKPRRGSGSSL